MQRRAAVVALALLLASCGDEYVNVSEPIEARPADVSQLVDGRVTDAPAGTPPMAIEGASPAGPAVQIDGTITGDRAIIGIPVATTDPNTTAAFLDEATGTWQVAGGVLDPEAGLVYVETTHLSVWQAVSIPGWSIVGDLRDILADVTGLGDRGDAPTCEGEPVVVTVTSESTPAGAWAGDGVFRLDACATLEPDGGYRVKIVNRRPVAVRISLTGTDATVVSVQWPNAGDMVALGIDKLGRILGQPAFGGMLLSPGGEMELLVPGPAVFFGEVDNSGTMWTVLMSAAGMYGDDGWNALAELAEGWNLAADAPGDWKELTALALEQLWEKVLEKSGKPVLQKLAGVLAGSLVVAVRGAFEGGLAPWFGNKAVRIDVYEEPTMEPSGPGLTSCEGTDMSLFEPDVVQVKCLYPWALAESTTMIGSGPTVIVSLITTDPRAFVASWWEIEEGPEVSGYTVQALVDAGVDPASAQALFDALDACSGCAYRT